MVRRNALAPVFGIVLATLSIRALAQDAPDRDLPRPSAPSEAGGPPEPDAPSVPAPSAAPDAPQPQWVSELMSARPRPPPLHVDYASYGVALSVDVLVDAGAMCTGPPQPCILGDAGGLVLRGGYRSPGPWYFGGAYQFSKTDSSNLYRLGILQQLRGEMRYMLDTDYRTSPYVSWGIGGMVYGNEWGVETGGFSAYGGFGFETQVSRLAVFGVALHYQPMLFFGFTDTARIQRNTALAQMIGLEIKLEVRTELSRE